MQQIEIELKSYYIFVHIRHDSGSVLNVRSCTEYFSVFFTGLSWN